MMSFIFSLLVSDFIFLTKFLKKNFLKNSNEVILIHLFKYVNSVFLFLRKIGKLSTIIYNVFPV